jgi:hypothetical protein
VVTPEGFRGPFFKQNSGPKPRQEARWSHHRLAALDWFFLSGDGADTVSHLRRGEQVTFV